MASQENPHLYEEEILDDGLVRLDNGEVVDVYASPPLPRGKIYCERFDHREETLAEEKRREDLAREEQKAKERHSLRKYTNDPNLATHIVLRIVLRSGRVYTVAEVRIQNPSSAGKEAEKLFEQYYSKFKNEFIHVRKPRHCVIRCSSIDEMSIAYLCYLTD